MCRKAAGPGIVFASIRLLGSLAVALELSVIIDNRLLAARTEEGRGTREVGNLLACLRGAALALLVAGALLQS